MASIVARHTPTGTGSLSVTLDGSGSNRLIVLISVGRGDSGQILTAADINGTQTGVVEFTDSAATTFSIAVWNDAEHPGAGAATINVTYSSSVTQQAHVVYEIQDHAQQATPFFNVYHTVLTSDLTAGLQTQNVVDEAGVLGIACIGSRSSSFYHATVTSSANLGNDIVRDNTNAHVFAADTPSIADNDEDFSFDLTLTSGSAPGNGHIAVLAFAIQDTTPPTFDTAPAVDTTTDQGHTIDFTLDEAGTVYGVRLPDGATAPSVDQVIAGTDAADAAAPEAKSVVVAAGVENSFLFETASASTAYDYYIVATDDTDPVNKQASVTKIDATTLAPTVRIDSTVPAQPIPGAEFVINLIQASNATGKTVTFNGYAVTTNFQDINQIVIDSFPYPWELSTAESDFLTNYDLTVLDVTYSHTVTRQLQVEAADDYFTIQGSPYPAESIYADDTGIVDGQKHWGSFSVGGQFATVAVNGVVTEADNGSIYNYRIKDDQSPFLWSAAATETFNVGTPATVSISVNLIDINSTAQASLTGLRWAWYDSTDENALGTPTDTGVNESTTAAGLLEIDLPNSALTAGQTGTLVIGDTTGRKAAYNVTVA